MLHLLAFREKDENKYHYYVIQSWSFDDDDTKLLKGMQQRFPHFSHAWLIILQCYALSIWIVALALTCSVWAVWVRTTEHPLSTYVLVNMVASCMGVTFTFTHLVPIWRKKRPYELRSWKKEPKSPKTAAPSTGSPRQSFDGRRKFCGGMPGDGSSR
jgi:hypothetical protein